MELTPKWSLNGFQLVDPKQLAESLAESNLPIDSFWGKANSFTVVRGRKPSRGWVLVGQPFIESVKTNFHLPRHTLSIQDGQRSVSIPNLIISRYEAVSPDNVGKKITKDAIYLVELVDKRHYANWTTANKLYNGLNLDGTLHKSATKTYLNILEDLWKESLQPLLGKLTVKTGLPVVVPETIGFVGTPGWDSINDFASKLGLVIAPNKANNGFDLHAPSDKFDDERELDKARTSYLIDSEDSVAFSPLPSKIRVHLQARDYQYQRSESATSQDHWSLNPAIWFDHETRRLNPKVGGFVVPETTMPVWCAFSARTDDHGKPIDEEALKKKAESFATTLLKGMTDRDTYRSETFSGVWLFLAGPFFSGVAIFDTGEGIKTRAFTQPYGTEMDAADWNRQAGDVPSNEPMSPPDLARITAPYERIVHGEVTPVDPQDAITGACVVRDPNLSNPASEKKGNLLPGKAGWLTIAYFQVNPGRVSLTALPSIRVLAFNGTDQPIPYNLSVTARFHLQAGQGGEWIIFTASGAYPDWQSACVDEGYAPIVQCVRSPGLITVRKNGGLILRSRNKNREAMIDLAGAPDGYVMSGRGKDKPPVWKADVHLLGSIRVDQWVKFSSPGQAEVPEAQTWLGPPSQGRIKLRLPNHRKAKKNAFLIALAGDGATCIPTEWFGPGLSLSVSFSGNSGKSCNQSSCVTLTFKHGLLMEQKGLQLESQSPNDLPAPTASCNDKKVDDYELCKSGQGGSSQPPPVIPGNPFPFEPDPNGDGDGIEVILPQPGGGDEDEDEDEETQDPGQPGGGNNQQEASPDPGSCILVSKGQPGHAIWCCRASEAVGFTWLADMIAQLPDNDPLVIRFKPLIHAGNLEALSGVYVCRGPGGYFLY